jgi:hypothetical protein
MYHDLAVNGGLEALFDESISASAYLPSSTNTTTVD